MVLLTLSNLSIFSFEKNMQYTLWLYSFFIFPLIQSKVQIAWLLYIIRGSLAGSDLIRS